MADDLTTVAVLSFEQAQILRTILESEGIDVFIYNVNLIQPIISEGVRVRIKQEDLSKALQIMSEIHWSKEDNSETKYHNRVLIPIDFSDHSYKACVLGFNYASLTYSEIVLLNIYFTPFFPSTIPIGDTSAYELQNSQESIELIYSHAKNEMKNFCQMLDLKIKQKELPPVKYKYILREGLPEEEIDAFSEEYCPTIIFMGTRGKNKKEFDLIGSVAAEVIENIKYPILAIPDNIQYNSLNDIKNVAFATSFNQRDLKTFEKFKNIFDDYNIKIHLFNISTSKNEWNEIRLIGLRDFFNEKYNLKNITYHVLDDGDLYINLEKFISANKIDLICVGNHKRSIFSKLFNTSMASKVLFHFDIPLLVISS